MSYTYDVLEELSTVVLPKTCCRRAMILGLLFGAQRQDDGSIFASLKLATHATLADEILQKQFGIQPKIEPYTHAGRYLIGMSLSSRAIQRFLSDTDDMRDRETPAVLRIGARCPECSHAFLRGVFCTAGSINDPKKGYHLEITAKTEGRAQLLCELLTAEIAPPRRVKRGERIGIYYKTNTSIFDFLYYIGAVKPSFDFTNAFVEHDIRNYENRATNCVARNIERSVATSMRHLDAIEKLRRSGKFERMSEDLRYTATLKEQNSSASLSELAAMHEPPISKSGLNRRLTKIEALAQDEKK